MCPSESRTQSSKSSRSPRSPRSAKQKKWREAWKIHPVAALFPRMSPDRLKQLKDDIKIHGCQDKPMLWESHGQIHVLDGQNRLDAMEALGRPLFDAKGEPNLEFVQVAIDAGGYDPVPEIISRNLQRRDLTPEQRVKIWEQFRRKAISAKVSRNRPGRPKSIVGEAAAALNLSRMTVRKHLSTKAKKSKGAKKKTTKKAASPKVSVVHNVENFELIQFEKYVRTIQPNTLSAKDVDRIGEIAHLLSRLVERSQIRQHQIEGGAR
jgi:hypothetical protein